MVPLVLLGQIVFGKQNPFILQGTLMVVCFIRSIYREAQTGGFNCIFLVPFLLMLF